MASGVRLVPQVTILDEGGEVVARVDFVVEGTKVIVEFDGMVKDTVGAPDALFAEKRREDRPRRPGYPLVTVTWADLHHPGRVVAWIRSAVAAAGVLTHPDFVPHHPGCQRGSGDLCRVTR